jgi:hypothetical protein
MSLGLGVVREEFAGRPAFAEAHGSLVPAEMKPLKDAPADHHKLFETAKNSRSGDNQYDRSARLFLVPLV